MPYDEDDWGDEEWDELEEEDDDRGGFDDE